MSHTIVSKSGICIFADTRAFLLTESGVEISAGRVEVRGFCAYH